jgi:asparagine synthetase B (glutamine-hydrolysing)
MSILGSFNRDPGQPLEPVLLSQVGREYPVTTFQIGRLSVAVHLSPEVSLSDIRGEAGDRKAVVVLGYIGVPSVEPASLAEYLLARWHARGPSFLVELNGSFALLLADEAAGSALLAVDCLSSRTMWQSRVGQGFVFGSHVQPVATIAGSSREPDPAYVYSFLFHDRTVDGRSPYRGITALDAGSSVLLANDEPPQDLRYCEPRFEPVAGTLDDLARTLSTTLRAVVADAKAGSREPCLFLSGGLDSRLVASVSPAGMSAVTLGDRENRETRIASRAAAMAGLPHRLLIRPNSWYPDDLVPASLANDGIWDASHAHYHPLRLPEYEFGNDVAVLGYGSNLYVRGSHLGWSELWRPRPADTSPKSRLLDLVRTAPCVNPLASEFFTPAGMLVARKAFEETSELVVDRVLQFSDQLPDLWDLYWCGSMTTVSHAANIACLRDFTSERNAFSDRRIHQLYLQIPPRMRASGQVARRAMAISSRELNRLPDANTWLPMSFPRWLHRSAWATRKAVAGVRRARLGASRSADYRSRGSWPHYGILLATNQTMRAQVERLLAADSPADDLLDRPRIRGCWEALSNGDYRYGDAFAALVTMLVFLLPKE